jgi:hypothetical protein
VATVVGDGKRRGREGAMSGTAENGT